jgi:NosR/NirI family transcriptional regulator, nitrous oxide reductase regulator
LTLVLLAASAFWHAAAWQARTRTTRLCVFGILRMLVGTTLLVAALCPQLSGAGELQKADIERRFPPPLRVGDKLREIPAWPLTSELEPDAGPVGYAFESIDLAAIPGFEGTPFNLLIGIDRQGNFLGVEVLRQHEPVFLGGLGPKPLLDFVRQYEGKSLRSEITVGSSYAKSGSPRDKSSRVVLDGVTKATASVRIVNQTVLAAALSVARSRLGFAETGNKRPPAKVRPAPVEAIDFASLLADGYISRLRLSNREVEILFADSEAAGLDAEVLAKPDDIFVDLYVGYLSAPTIGRSLLGERAYEQLQASVYHGQHLFWIASTGRYSILEEGFVPGTAPSRLSMVQDGLPLELTDFGGDDLRLSGRPEFTVSRVFQVGAHSGLDPARPIELRLGITRAKGAILPLVTERVIPVPYRAPAHLFEYPPQPLPEWLVAWRDRWVDIALIVAGLIGLALVLSRPDKWFRNPRHFDVFRKVWLLLSVGYLGWYAQGQLSIVHLTSAAKSISRGHGLGSFLYDPVCLLLIAFLPLSFVLWGRGTFCGWLCPFGAMQELVSEAARRLGFRKRQMPPRLGRLLSSGRFVLLGGLVMLAVLAPAVGERMVEVEPFKTAITVGFDRSWPFVAYAVALLAAGIFYYKFFCRFICPLGACMELGGKLRRFDWLRRRSECGKPCQVCRNACDYGAIEQSGEIRYDDCFQCLACVTIYHSPTHCVPLIRQRKAQAAAMRRANM